MRTPVRVYGPYLDGSKRRMFVIRIYDDGSRKSTSYARHLLETDLGRELTEDEEADHIDRNPLNNDRSNLQVLTRGAHRSKTLRERPPAATFVGVCPGCGVEFRKPLSIVRHNRRQGKAGPFCGKVCAGRHTAAPR